MTIVGERRTTMTGRDLIILILNNHLEDVVVFEDLRALGFYTIEEAAVKLHIGIESIKAQCSIDAIRNIKIGDKTYIYIEE